MSYYLGIDVGTTFSAAAVCRSDRANADIVALGERANAVPSAVFADERGALLFGVAAERRALSDPGRVVRGFKRRIGDGVPMLVGGVPVAAEELAARFAAKLVEEVAAREGGPAAGIAVTHPASWGPHRLDSLRTALAAHGLGAAMLITEPQAAARGYAAAERVEPGAVVAVYDLGGGTFDAAVARKLPDGGFELLGTPEGIDGLGGIDFDEFVFEHVRAALGPVWEELDPSDPTTLTAVARLRRECTEAKEALSADTEVLIPVVLPGHSTQVRLTRSEFEDAIRPAVAETVAALRRALDSAGTVPGEPGAVVLVGGSSRIPLVAQLVSAACGQPASVDVDPKGVIAAGAALTARGAAVGEQTQRLPIALVEPTDVRVDPEVPSPPPRQPRPPQQVAPAPRRRRVGLLVAAGGVVAAALIGGLVANAVGTRAVETGTSKAGAATPGAPAVVDDSAPLRQPPPQAPAPAPANRRTAPTPTTPAQSTTTPPKPPTTTAPPQPPTTSEPPQPPTTSEPPRPSPEPGGQAGGGDGSGGAPAGDNSGGGNSGSGGSGGDSPGGAGVEPANAQQPPADAGPQS
ncbi:Hsp70 family protein [Pseudonocardia hispaniensis]|uniref:Hsp70 family protein n=1 Tax=Pseudonocardia hispaniensis TaxID=904933 RepID=A0ABW1J7C1_9PSEU